MTDYPRFQTPPVEFETAHRGYHGAPIVQLVLALADLWVRTKRAKARAGCALGTVEGSTHVHVRQH